MVGEIQRVEEIRYTTIDIPKLTRGIAKNSNELIGNTTLIVGRSQSL